jgi:3-phosphoshikimate 1-carboxyvinyltransferase
MDFLVLPSALESGSIAVPGDKSISHRALMLGSIALGKTVVSGFLAGEDCLATMRALRQMGVPIDEIDEATLQITGVGLHGLQAPKNPLDLGNSGTAMRLMAGLLCGQSFASSLKGDESLSGRPMQRIIEPLSAMGAIIDSNDGKPPLELAGGTELAAINYQLPVASAQVKSAILLAGLYAVGETFITEPAITRDHTERMLRSMGVSLNAENGRIRMPGQQILKAADIEVPGDLSSAAFLIVAALLAPNCELLIQNVGVNPTRSGVLQILREMGADIQMENARLFGDEPVVDLRVRSSVLKGIDVDSALVPLAIDEFPVLFIAAAAASGVTRFSGIGELRIKESDRIDAMAKGLRKLGITVNEKDDTAEVHGASFSAGTIDSHGDHRIAMSFAVAATIADDAVQIRNVDTVNTSFPGFSECMGTIGLNITQRLGGTE